MKKLKLVSFLMFLTLTLALSLACSTASSTTTPTPVATSAATTAPVATPTPTTRAPANPEIIMASTTSTGDSGLMDALIPIFQQKMVVHMAGVLKGKEGRSLFLNFLTDISPACDCYGHADRPIVRDIGILASIDPVAIDQASADLVNREPGNRDSALTKNFEAGEDKFRGVYPQIDWERQLVYGEEIGLGTRQYELIAVPPKV